MFVMIYRIALNFGGAKLWRISLHKNFEVLNFGEMSTKQIIVHNLEGYIWRKKGNSPNAPKFGSTKV